MKKTAFIDKIINQMTEQEYCDMTDLAKIRIAFNILQDVVPLNSSVVDVEGHNQVMLKLLVWRDKLTELSLKRNNEEEDE